MATRSFIGKIEKAGIRAIYCHNDGYIEHSGRVLWSHYQAISKIDELLNLGDLSSLKANIGEQHGFADGGADVCTSYKRDRGETGKDAVLYKSLDSLVRAARDNGAAYIYLHDTRRWLVSAGDDRFIALGDELMARECD